MIDRHLYSEVQEVFQLLLLLRVHRPYLVQGHLQPGLRRLCLPAQPRIGYEVTVKEFLGLAMRRGQPPLN